MSNVTTPVWISLLSGFAGGIADTIFNYPPYGIHIRKERREVFNWKHLSPRMLYCGATAYGAGMIPATVIQLTMTNTINEHLPRMASAFIGGTIGAFIYTPVGNIIVNQQKLMPIHKAITPQNYVTMSKAIRHINNTHGIMRFWTGLAPTMIRDGIYSGAVFWAYGRVKERFAYIQSKHARNIVIATVLGTVTSLISHPFDAIATRMQDHVDKISPWNMAHKMWTNEGLRAFYRGALYRCYAVVAGIYVVEGVSMAVEQYLLSLKK